MQCTHSFTHCDYDLTGYTRKQLSDITDFKLLTQTNYPKLVLFLLQCKPFCEWFQENNSTNTPLQLILQTILEYDKIDTHCNSISLSDILFWKMMVMCQFSDTLRKEGEQPSLPAQISDLQEQTVTNTVDSVMNVSSATNHTRKRGMRTVWIS
jgi:hypothetical protein